MDGVGDAGKWVGMGESVMQMIKESVVGVRVWMEEEVRDFRFRLKRVDGNEIDWIVMQGCE